MNFFKKSPEQRALEAYNKIAPRLDPMDVNLSKDEFIKSITELQSQLLSLKGKAIKDRTVDMLINRHEDGFLFTRQAINACLKDGRDDLIVGLYRDQPNNDVGNGIKDVITVIIKGSTQLIEGVITKIDGENITYENGTSEQVSSRVASALRVNEVLRIREELLPPDMSKSRNFIA